MRPPPFSAWSTSKKTRKPAEKIRTSFELKRELLRVAPRAAFKRNARPNAKERHSGQAKIFFRGSNTTASHASHMTSPLSRECANTEPCTIWALHGQISWKSVRKGVFSLGVVVSAQYARILHCVLCSSPGASMKFVCLSRTFVIRVLRLRRSVSLFSRRSESCCWCRLE